MKTCQEIMTSNPTCCTPSEMVYTVAQRMQNEDIGALPVVESYEQKRVIGMLTDRDLALRVVGASQDPTSTAVQDVMSPKPIVCHPDDNVDNVLKMMAEHQIRRVPVVDEDGRVVGIISQADIVLQVHDSDKVAHVVEQISQPDLVSDLK